VLLDRQGDTPFDLRFRLFGTPVRVLPWFWLVTAFLQFELIGLGIEVLLLWVFCVFVSILLHEFGHIWMGRIFGSHGHIVLQSLCGMAVGATNGVNERWKRIAVSLAGPGIQLLFFALLSLGLHLAAPSAISADWGPLDYLSSALNPPIPHSWPRLAYYAVQFLLMINWYWAMLNLLPIWPLDGGQVSRELFTWQSRIYGARNSMALSLATALAVTINAISGAMQGPTIPYLPSGGKYFIVFFAIFAFESFMLLQMESAKIRHGWRDPDDDRQPWERDPDEWKNG
jgi:stage IV sporulation protein FB